MTEDKPNQPDFTAISEKWYEAARYRSDHQANIFSYKDGYEDCFKDHVSAVKEENKQLRDKWWKINVAINEPYNNRMCRDCADGNGTCENTGLPCDPTDEIIARYNRLKSELSKKGEPINSELLNALKSVIGFWMIANQSHYNRNSDAVNKFKALIERAESTPLEPVKSLQEEMLVILEEICETYPEYYDNPVGHCEYSCVFCTAMISRKGGEPSVAMDDLPHKEYCTYAKAKTLLKKNKKSTN
jgi:hypothetical protein